jgi:hypothetical protein
MQGDFVSMDSSKLDDINDSNSTMTRGQKRARQRKNQHGDHSDAQQRSVSSESNALDGPPDNIEDPNSSLLLLSISNGLEGFQLPPYSSPGIVNSTTSPLQPQVDGNRTPHNLTGPLLTTGTADTRTHATPPNVPLQGSHAILSFDDIISSPNTLHLGEQQMKSRTLPDQESANNETIKSPSMASMIKGTTTGTPKNNDKQIMGVTNEKILAKLDNLSQAIADI